MSTDSFAGPKSNILYEQSTLKLTVSDQADEQAIGLLQQTIYGTEGVRYRQTGQGEKIHQLHNPKFFHLYDHRELIGFYCLDQRLLTFPGASVSGYYGRYLAVRSDKQGKGYGQLLKSTAVNHIEQTVATPHLFYSYIEGKNTRSMAASLRENFESVARLKTFMFRRFSPQVDPRFRQASLVDRNLPMQLVKHQYNAYGFQNFSNINYQNNYFTLEENGQILAGVHANPILWKIVHIPGRLGSIIKYIAPFVPGLRRFFNPAQQTFVVLEGVFVDQTRPELLSVLLESVLGHFERHTAMWQIDERDPLLPLLNNVDMGRFSQFQPGVITHVMVKTTDVPAQIQLSKEPVYISCFDYS